MIKEARMLAIKNLLPTKFELAMVLTYLLLMTLLAAHWKIIF